MSSYTRYSGPSDYSEVLTDDRRKCEVEGCHKKHAFRKPDGFVKVYSRYCENHTCGVPFSAANGTHCATPRKPSDRFCTIHLTCREPGCAKMGEFIGGPRDYIPWFCRKHRCTAPDCRERATDRQQQCCTAHFMKCSVPDCTRPAHLHRHGHLDAVCAVHYGTYRCKHPNCSRWSSSRHCASHRCAVADCPAGRDTTLPGAAACRQHLCTTPLCPNPLLWPSDPRAAHCSLHSCRTAACSNPRRREPGSDHCTTHTCLTAGCRSEARFPASHCERHACVVVTCAHPRLSAVSSSTLGVGLDRERCAAHAQARERRSASLDADGIGLDWQGLRGRFEMNGERERERDRKRLSDDLERLRRREREMEAERVWVRRESEGERERLERLQRDFEARRRRDSMSGPGWGAW